MILTYVCFPSQALDAATVADLLSGCDLGFAPKTIRTDQFGRPNGVAFTSRALDRLRNADELRHADVNGEDDASFAIASVRNWSMQLIIVRTPQWPPGDLIEATSRLGGFTSALVGDDDDVFWQGQEQIDVYKRAGRPWQHLPTVWDDAFRTDRIDVSQNPGRKTHAPGMWLWAAAKMWFGPPAFELLDRDLLLTLPIGHVTERDDGVIAVDLYSLDDPETARREAQRRFREWMQYDNLEPRLSELAREKADPKVMFAEGVFENGATRRVTEWLTAEGEPTYRSRATTRRVSYLDAAGQLITTETAPTD